MHVPVGGARDDFEQISDVGVGLKPMAFRWLDDGKEDSRGASGGFRSEEEPVLHTVKLGGADGIFDKGVIETCQNQSLPTGFAEESLFYNAENQMFFKEYCCGGDFTVSDTSNLIDSKET